MLPISCSWDSVSRWSVVVGLSVSLGFGLALPAAAQVEEAVDSAEVWLLARQNADGSFGDVAELRPRDAAITVLALAGRETAGTALSGVATYLASVPEANVDFRSQRALALAEAGQNPTALLASIGEFRNGGGMGAFSGHQSTLLDTAFAIQALALEEGFYQLDIVTLLDYLQNNQGGDGGWGFAVGTPSELYYSGETLDALANLEQLAIGQAVTDGVAGFLLARQQADGGFGSVLDTAVAYRGLLALGRSEGDFPFGSPVPYLLARQQVDGSWQGDVFTTAQVVRVLRGQKPNLRITALELAPPDPIPGTLVEVRVTVENNGPRAADTSQLSLRRDTVDGTLLDTLEIPTLASGETAELVFSFDTTGLSGAFDLHVKADSDDVLDESSENDNADLARLTLRGGPDLALFPADLSLDPASPLPDQSFQLLINARNLGESEVASFDWRVMRRVAGVPTDQLAAGSAGPMGPGGALLIPVALTLAEGEHSIEVVLDPANTIEEEGEDNNLTSLDFFVVDPSQPDLAVLDADVTLTPAEPAAGESVDVAVTVRNLGDREAASELVIYENDPSDGGVELVRLPFTATAGEAVPLSTMVTTGGAAHSFTFLVDPDGLVLETDESNNQLQRFFRELPDLALGFDNLDLVPATPLAGDPVSVDVTVRNAGTADATAVEVELWEGDPTGGGTLVASTTLASVPAKGNRRATFSWTASGGAHRLVVVADPTDAILELSESNNQTARRVAVPRGSGPDLEVTAVDLSALAGDPVSLALGGTLAVTLANTGDAEVTETFQLRLFADVDGNRLFGGADTLLASELVSGGLGASSSRVVQVTVSSTAPFHHPLAWAEADATDVVAERREDNNLRSLFADCEIAPPATSLEPIEEWYLPGLNVETVPLVAQLTDDNGDGRIDSRDVADIVVQASDAVGNGIFALSGLDGSEVWTFRSSSANPLANHLAQAALADLDGDGLVEILGHQTNGRFVLLEHDGRLKWVSDTVPGVGNRHLGTPAIGDLDADGVPEIVLGRTVLDAGGTRLAVGTGNSGNNWNYYGPFGSVLVPGVSSYQQAVIADVDLDGRNELVVGDTLYRFVGGVLEIVWNKTVPDNLMRDGFVAVGNLDGDPEGEIVYVSSGQIMVLNHDGSTRAGRRTMVPFIPFQMPTFWGGNPTIADLDGDGTSEILVVTATHVIAYSGGLGTRWRRAVGEDFGGFTGITAFDLDGDGASEVLFNNESTFYILDGRNGAVLHTLPNRTFTAMEHAAVADVDGDGRAEIILPSNRDRGGNVSTQGIHVLGHPSWQGARPIWNQYSYHVTNVGLDGTVPSPQIPPWQLYGGFRANLATPAPPASLPNLTVSLPRVGQPTAEGVPVTVRVGNGGREPVPAGLLVELYDGAPGSVPAVGSATTPVGLRPGAFLDLEILWQGASDGAIVAWVMVDPTDGVVECDEGDNSFSFDLEATVLPDLAIAAGGVTAPSPSPVGAVVPVSVAIENLGIAGAPASVVRLYSGDPASGPVLAEAAIPALEAGESTTVEVVWATLGSTAGLYTVHAVLDPDALVNEGDESNNRGLTEIELVAPSTSDLTLGDFTITPDTVAAGAPVALGAEVVNLGAPLEGGFTLAFRVNLAEVGRVTSPTTLGMGESRSIDFTLDTAAFSGVLTVDAVADPDGAVSESDEGNNTASGTLTVDASPLVLAIDTDKLSYTAGEDVVITLLTTNNGDTATTGDLVLDVIDSVGLRVAQVAAEAVALPVGETTLSYTWNTGSTFAGTYSVVGSLGIDGAVGASGTRLFSIAGQVAATASLFADRDVYTPLQSAVFNGSVSNQGSNQALESLTARIAVRGPGANGAEVFSAELLIEQLLPGASRPLTTLWEIGNVAGGDYLATLELRDVSGLLIAYAETGLVIEDSASTGSGLDGVLAVTPEVVGAGSPLLADVEVSNSGNADMPELALRIDMRRLADGELVFSTTRSTPLAQGENAHRVFGLPTAGLAEEDYLITLTGILPGAERRLDGRAVSVARGVSVADASLFEGDGGAHTVELAVTLSSASDEAVTLAYATADGTATAGSDYQAASGSLSFAPGETVKTIALTVFGDLDAEPSETFLLGLSNAVGVAGGDLQGLVTLLDEEGCTGPNLIANPGAESAIQDAWAELDVTEGNGWLQRFADPVPLAGTAYFAYGGMNPEVELQQTLDLEPYAARIDGAGQAFALAGFVRTGGEEPRDSARVVVEYLDAQGGVLATFDSGETTPTDWQAVSDQRVVPSGTRAARVRLLVREQNGGGDVSAFFDQLELRSLGVPVLVAGSATFLEGDSGTTAASLPLSLSCPATAAQTVGFMTSDLVDDPDAELGAAIAGVDYQAADSSVTLPAGSTTGAIELELLGDILDERDETFRLELVGDTGIVVLTPVIDVVITDDDGAVTLSVADVTVSEGAGTVELLLELSAVSGRQARIGWATTAGTAVAGGDFVAASGVAVFPPGTTQQTVTLSLVADAVHEPEESFALTLSSPINLVPARSAATITVTDDDPLTIAVIDPPRTEEGDPPGGGEAVFTVALSYPSVLPVSIAYSTADAPPEVEQATAGVDYQAVSGALNFAPGTTELTVSVPLIADLEREPSEIFLLLLSNPSVGSLSDPEGVGTIFDDDGILISIADKIVYESPGNLYNLPGSVVRASSQYSASWPPTRAVDGNLNTSWFPSCGDSANQGSSPWIEIELAQDAEVTELRVWGNREFANGHDIFAGFFQLFDADGIVLFDSGIVQLPDPWRDYFLPVAKIAGVRRARFTSTDDQSCDPGLSEFEVLGTAPFAVNLPVTLSKAATFPVSVDFATVDGTALEGSDYLAVAGTLEFDPGVTQLDVPLQVLGDTFDEPIESFFVQLSNAVESQITDGEGEITIIDNELWWLNGEGSITATPAGCVQLTPDTGNRRGTAWRREKIDLRENFDKTFRVYLGTRDSNGADGIVFTLQNSGRFALGGSGPAMGYYNIQPSVGLEIDTHDNGNYDPSADHIAVSVNGQYWIPEGSTPQASATTANIEDGQEHLLRVVWNAESQELDAHFDGVHRKVWNRDIVTDIFSGNERVFYGFTGGNGHWNYQYFCEVQLCGEDSLPQLSVGHGYLTEGDGTGTAMMSVPVTLSCPASETITVDYATSDDPAADDPARVGEDYEAVAGTLTFAPGETSAWIEVPIHADDLAEPDETFLVELSHLQGGFDQGSALWYTSGIATILTDDVVWHLNGDGAEDIPQGCLRLTTDGSWRRGSAWRSEKIDLGEHFDMTFDVYAGTRDSNGADGLTFTLQNQGTTALGGNGASMGWGGITPGVAVELDTYDNGSYDPSADHLAIDTNGSITNGQSTAIQASPTAGNIEDNQRHAMRIVWNADAKALDVHFEDSERIYHERDFVADIFGGTSEVWWGFTGGSGARNVHYFCPTRECFGHDASPSISVGDVRVVEGDGGSVNALFPVTLHCPSQQPVTVRYTAVGDTARVDEDFVATTGTLTFQPGETSKTVAVPIVSDDAPEETETFFLDLSQPSGGQLRYGRGVGTIITDDIGYRITNSLLAEGDGGTYSYLLDVELTAPAPSSLTFSFSTADGTAVAGEDYVPRIAGTTTFSAGSRNAGIRLDVLGDTVLEGDETFFLDITGPAGGLVPDLRIELAILDDDDCPSPNLLINGDGEQGLVDGVLPGWTEYLGADWQLRSSNPGPFEGSSYIQTGVVVDAELRQEVDISGFANRIDVGLMRFELIGVTRSYNQNPTDTGRVVLEYLDATGQVIESYDSGIRDNRSWWQAFGDLRTAPTGSRTLRLRLISHRNNGSNNDAYYDGMVLRALRLPTLSGVDASVQEGEAGLRPMPFNVQLSCASDVPVVVDYLTSDGTATAGTDYQAVSGQLTFAPGETNRVVEVPVIGDIQSEDDEVFFFNLLNPVNGGVARAQAVGTILQDEVLLIPGNTAVTEGNGGTTGAVFTLTLSGASSLPISVDYATGGGSAISGAEATEGTDYLMVSGTVTFAPGETTKSVVVPVLGDLEVEPDETFRLNLTNPINVTLADTRGYCDIFDDDVELSIGDDNVAEGDAGTVPAVFEVVLSKVTSNTVTVSWTTEDGLAIAGEDYQAGSGTLTFAPGEIRKEIRVQVIGDTLLENSETFSVFLTTATNAMLADDEGVGVIIEDDDCPGPNLLVNGGAEEAEGSEIRGWTEVSGSGWIRRGGDGNRQAFAGSFMFYAANVEDGELRQDVDLTPYAVFIDAGLQRFSFQGFVTTHRNDDDPARIIVEYLDAAGTVLDSYDSGEIVDPTGWQQVADLRRVPVGTRGAAIRLLTRKTASETNADGYFDGLALRSVGTPVMSVEDLEIPEGDTSSVFADFDIRLTCASEKVMHLDYQTVDGTATAADDDYIAASGTLDFAIGEESQILSIEIPGDFKNELIERFTVDFSNEIEMVVLDATAEAAIRDADPGAAPVPGVFSVYTLDEQFDTGSLVSVHHETPLNDQLQLVENGSTFPFIWIALSNRGTIVKIDVETGQILGEYSTSPDNRGSNPSRTTVALDGSAWVGNRSGRSVAHVGLPELNQCVDKNGNGFIETSAGYGDVLPWPNASGQDTSGGVSTAVDECILHYVPTSSTGTRHISVTQDNDVWVSGTGYRHFDLIDGETGQILRTVTGFSCGGYGGLIDGNGIIWSVTSGGSVLRWDPSVDPPTAESRRCLGGMAPYGVGIDSDGWIWISSFSGNRVRKVSPDGNTIIGPFGHGESGAQGLAVDANDEVWLSSNLYSGSGKIGHVKKDGSFVGSVTGACTGSTGMAVDANGKIWAACYRDGKAARIDPNGGPVGADGVTPIGAVDLIVDLPGSNPYNYSDMTGFVALRSTAPQGTFSVIQDSGIEGAEWGNVSWNTEPEAFVPEGGSIVVEVRASETVPGLGGTSWTAIESGVSFEIYGRYLQVRTTLRPAPDGTSPVLSDLRIGVVDDAQVAVGDATVVEGDAGDGRQLVFPVTFAEPTVLDTTFDYTVLDGGAGLPAATGGSDYAVASGTLTILAGQTTGSIVVDVLGDDLVEGDETLTLLLSNPSNAVFLDGEGLGTIVDDDVAELALTKVDTLGGVALGDAEVDPGEVVTYVLSLSSVGTGTATGITLGDQIPLHTTVVAGSVTTSQGVVLGDDPVSIEIGALAPGDSVTITFDVRLDDPFPDEVEQIANQAVVSSVETGDLPSDDPETLAAADPTLTRVAAPGATTVCESVAWDAADWTLTLLGDADQGEAMVVDPAPDGPGRILHLSGDGTSLFHGLDNGAFYHRPVASGADFRIEVAVSDFPVDEGGEVRKAALMLRTGLDPSAARVMVTFVPHMPPPTAGDPLTTGLQFDARLADGEIPVEIGNTVFDVPLSTRLAIEKRGDVATAYYSLDGGITWIQASDATYGGSATIDFGAAGETLRAGVMVASYDADVTLTAELMDYGLCRPDVDPPVDPPNPPVCDPAKPIDAIVLLDTSGSMTAGIPGAGSKLEAAQAAIDHLVNELSAAPAGSRMALVSVAGFRTPAENLAGAWEVVVPLGSDFSAVNAAAQAIDGSAIEPGRPTAAALAWKGLITDLVPTLDPAHQPVVIWISDGIANIDILGRGPEPYELEELQSIDLRDADGDFLSWGQVGWSGDFNGELGTFDGEPLANTMFQIERFDRRAPETLAYGLALEGDGIDLGTFNPGLLDYAAHVTGARSFRADSTAALLASVSALVTDLECGGLGTAVLGGRLWNDRDGDGLESADTSATGEPGLEGVTVGLYDGDGLGLFQTTTDAAGTFVFGELPAGTYSVQVDATTLPLGEGGQPIDEATYDLDGLATVDTITMSLADGEVRSNASFGYREPDAGPPAEICTLETFDGPALDPLWQLVEIGDADQGEATVVDGTLHLGSDGTSLFHGTDNGAFVHRAEDGDFRLEVKVAGIPDDVGGAVRKGCLMARTATGPSDPRLMVCYIPHLPGAATQALQFDVRHEDGTAEEIADLVINAVLPVRLAIEREGDLMWVEYSLDNGLSWTRPTGLLGGEVMLALGQTPLVGMMVASYDATIPFTLAFDEFEVCRPNPELP